VVYEPALDLVTDIYPCEDGHDSERNTMKLVQEPIAANDWWIADRPFCTTLFLLGIHRRSAAFIIREHAQKAPWINATDWVAVGTTDAGTVAEPTVYLVRAKSAPILVRRIKIQLHQPTRNGETEIYLLSNRPAPYSAVLIAEGYGKHGMIETAFQAIEFQRQSEIPTVAHPRAALFVFAIALVIFNIDRIVKNIVRVEQGSESAQSLSGYTVANEVQRSYDPINELIEVDLLAIRLPTFVGGVCGMVAKFSAEMYLPRYRKTKQSPKKPKPKIVYDPKPPHVSTYRKLPARKKKI
jgi:hypothetical protein